MLGRTLCSSFFSILPSGCATCQSTWRLLNFVASTITPRFERVSAHFFFRHGERELQKLFTILRLSSFHWACDSATVANDPWEFLRLRVHYAILRYATKEEEEMVPVWFRKGPSQRSRRLVQRLRQSSRKTTTPNSQPIWSVLSLFPFHLEL